MRPIIASALCAWLCSVLPAFAGACEECVSPQCRMMFCEEGEGDSRPFYCHEGSWAHVSCKPNGDVSRYHRPGSPYRDTPLHFNRYGDPD